MLANAALMSQIARPDRKDVVLARIGLSCTRIDCRACRRETLPRGPHQARLDLVWSKTRFSFQEQSSSAADHRSSDTGPAKPQIGGIPPAAGTF